MSYLLIKTLHLLAAIAFIGTLFFQVAILGASRHALDESDRTRLSQALGKRARHVIHIVALVLYGCGILLVWPYRQLLHDPFASNFALLLSLKILLAVLIVGHYVLLIVLRMRNAAGERGMRLINLSLLLHAVLLVVCAKAMFVL